MRIYLILIIILIIGCTSQQQTKIENKTEAKSSSMDLPENGSETNISQPFMYEKKDNESIVPIVQPPPKQTEQNLSKTDHIKNSGRFSFGKPCSWEGAVNFTSPPRRLEDIGLIEPIGLMIGNHVTPIDHGYYYPSNWKHEDNPIEFKDVLAPANGIITEIETMGGRKDDYRLVIHYTCTFYTIYIHVKELSPRIKQFYGGMEFKNGKGINVTAGEVIGRANAFDFSVHDDNVVLKGFITPKLYEGESWKIHTVDMFAYFVEPIKSQLLAKNIREKEPRGGKIDYDVDGKLVGNWFVENSGGYAGLNRGIDNYKTHLAFAYDGLDPSLVVVSMGNFNNEPKQFAVINNKPDPISIDKSDGIIKYELVDIDYMIQGTGEYWDRRNYAKGIKAIGRGDVLGVVLVQMIEDRKIKFEVFPGKTASEVNGFSNPKIYER